MNPVALGSVVVGTGRPLALVAGPCVIEGREHTLALADALARTCLEVGLPLVFKASYDKANRTSINGFRGPGIDRGLAILAEVRERVGVPVLTDVHTAEEARAAAQVVDVIQIPAFLCRQTDLVVAAAATGRPVNLKKGQFLAPDDMRHLVDKAGSAGVGGVLVTERGTSFGYHDLVFDPRSLVLLRECGCPVVFDGTHSVQRPGGAGGQSGGDRRFIPALVRAAVAIGVDAIFLEVHDRPDQALSDRATVLPLGGLGDLLRRVREIDAVGRAS